MHLGHDPLDSAELARVAPGVRRLKAEQARNQRSVINAVTKDDYGRRVRLSPTDPKCSNNTQV